MFSTLSNYPSIIHPINQPTHRPLTLVARTPKMRLCRRGAIDLPCRACFRHMDGCVCPRAFMSVPSPRCHITRLTLRGPFAETRHICPGQACLALVSTCKFSTICSNIQYSISYHIQISEMGAFYFFIYTLLASNHQSDAPSRPLLFLC